MFKKYLLEKFLPWSLKIDYKNSTTMISKEKEKFFCDMFNHFAHDFKDLNTYELHMFRVSFSTINIIGCELITVLLPEDELYNSLYILYNDEKCYYFTLNKNTYNYELVEYENGNVVDNISKDLSNLNEVLTNYILMK